MKLAISSFAVVVFGYGLLPAAVTVESVGLSGVRNVRVTNINNDSRYLHIGELEAFAPGVVPNGAAPDAVSLLRTGNGGVYVGQTGTTQHGATTAPLNGVVDTGGTTFSINPGVGNSYTAGRAADITVGDVRLWNRGDCCGERLANFRVDALDASNNVLVSRVNPGQPAQGGSTTLDFGTRQVFNPGGTGVVGTDTFLGTNARYLEAGSDTSSGGAPDAGFSLGEVEALRAGDAYNASGLTNASDFALSGSGATASRIAGSNAHGTDASLIDGAEQSGGASWNRNRTGTPATAGFFVDLGQSRDVGAVRLHQRNDGCCQGRLSDVDLTLYGFDGKAIHTANFPGQAPTNEYAQFVLPELLYVGTNDLVNLEVNTLLGVSDKLATGGQLLIAPGSTLSIDPLGSPYMIPYGTTLDLLDFASISGTFSTIDLPTHASLWDLSQLYTNGSVLALTPEPGRMTLGLFAFVAFAIRRNRRGKAA